MDDCFPSGYFGMRQDIWGGRIVRIQEIPQESMAENLQDGLTRGWKSNTGLSIFRSELYLNERSYRHLSVVHSSRLPTPYELKIIRCRICMDLEYMQLFPSREEDKLNPYCLHFFETTRDDLLESLRLYDLNSRDREKILGYYRFNDYFDNDFGTDACRVFN